MSETFTLFGVEINLDWAQVVLLGFVLMKLYEITKNQRAMISIMSSRDKANKGVGEF